jgi:phosphotransacetylase
VPEPDALQLCHIAGSAAQNMLRVAELQPRVAFLSFSTKGSAESASVLRVRQAAELFRQQFPNIPADGELQADAALVASVAERKSPASPLHGDANVLVFPNLDAGNIGYKLTERLAGAVALGPIVQGLSKPYCDLSRGCSADDIVNVACVAVLMSSLTA